VESVWKETIIILLGGDIFLYAVAAEVSQAKSAMFVISNLSQGPPESIIYEHVNDGTAIAVTSDC
jgi:hypothetical protein